MYVSAVSYLRRRKAIRHQVLHTVLHVLPEVERRKFILITPGTNN